MSRVKPLIRRNSRGSHGAREHFLEELRKQLRIAARERANCVLSMADADALRARLGGRYVELAFAEGDLFLASWWQRSTRYPGWALRPARREVRA